METILLAPTLQAVCEVLDRGLDREQTAAAGGARLPSLMRLFRAPETY